eukprot:gene810-105_t
MFSSPSLPSFYYFIMSAAGSIAQHAQPPVAVNAAAIDAAIQQDVRPETQPDQRPDIAPPENAQDYSYFVLS